MYEKLGFKMEGIRRQALYYNHRYYDSVIMSILQREYHEHWFKVSLDDEN